MEAECIGVKEALSWIMKQSGQRVTLESDSLLVCRALMSGTMNLLEVGHILEQCRLILRESPYVHYVMFASNLIG